MSFKYTRCTGVSLRGVVLLPHGALCALRPRVHARPVWEKLWDRHAHWIAHGGRGDRGSWRVAAATGRSWRHGQRNVTHGDRSRGQLNQPQLHWKRSKARACSKCTSSAYRGLGGGIAEKHLRDQFCSPELRVSTFYRDNHPSSRWRVEFSPRSSRREQSTV